MQATIKLEYNDEATATAIENAVTPDNSKAPVGLTVKTSRRGKSVITEIELQGKIATLISTINDLMEAASTAEKTLHIIKEQ